MTGKNVIRFAALALLFSLTLPAASINIFSMTPSATISKGDWLSAATVYNTDAGRAVGGVNYNPWNTSGTMITVGGVLEGGTTVSGAVSATNLGINNVANWLANGNTCVGALAGTCTDPTLETALGILTSDLNALLADPTIGVANGSAIAWTITPQATGDDITLVYDFVANDSADPLDPSANFNDIGFFSAVSATHTYVKLLGSVQSATDFADTGWTGFQYLFPSTETYTVAFGVVNVGPYSYPVLTPTTFNLDATNIDYVAPDNTYPYLSDSALLLDPAPEPGTWLLAGAGLLLTAFSKLRKAR